MTDKNKTPAPRRPQRWLKASLGAVAMGVMLASGGAWADDPLPAPICDPNKLYDILTSSFHQTAAQLADDRGWAGWGQQMYGAIRSYTTVDTSNNSQTKNNSDVAPPMSIMGSTSVGEGAIGDAFPDVKPLLVTTGSATTSHQTVALGNDGKFYAWGTQGTVLPSSYTNGTAVAATTLELPDGISAGEVDMLFASYQFLAMVAKGNVWVLVNSNNANLLGDGSSSADTDWHKVKTDANTDLTKVIAVRGQVGPGGTGAVMALTEEGEVYTWGSNIYLGDGSTGRPGNSGTRATSAFATKMDLPTPTNGGKVVQIGVTGGSNNAGSINNNSSSNINNSYYVLFKKEGEPTGELWSLGANTHRQLGTFNTEWSREWKQVLKPANPDGTGGTAPFADVKMFSVQEHDWGYAGSGSVAAIDSEGDVYTWGSNNGNMIGGESGSTSDPKVQGDLLKTKGSGEIKARYVEVGGHTTAYSPENSPKFCYVGHLTNGSMGNNTHNTGNPWQFDCDRTPAVNICGADPIGAVNDSMGNIPVPDVLTKLTGNAYSNDHYRGDPADKNIGDKNDPGASDGIFGKVLEPAQSINWGPVPYLDVATGEVYAPAGTPPGDYTIKYEICDVDFPEEICAAADITVTIRGIKAIPDTDSTTSGTPVTTPVTSNDTSPSGVPINHDSVTVVAEPPNGTVVCKGDTDGSHLESGQCQYTPNLGFKGTDTYTYQVCNTADPVECDTTTVTIAVGEPPAIAAYDDTAITTKGTPVTTPVVANDVAVGGVLDPNSVAKVGSVTGGPSGATTSLDCSAGYCTFQADQPGTYEYTYKVCLVYPATTCDEAKVKVTVAETIGGGGTTPTPTIVASPDYDTTPVNTPVTTVVIGNDNAVGGVVNAASVEPVGSSSTQGGTIAKDGNGKIKYTPPNDFVGTDTYEYTVCLVDPAATCSTTTVTIKVGDPSITARDDETIPGAPKDVGTNDIPTGGELDKPGIKVITPPDYGTVDCENGVCTYTSGTPDNPLDDSYVYQVCLAGMPDICSTATVTVKGLKVEAVDDEKILTSWDPLELTPVENDSCLESGDSEICQKEQVTTTLYTEGETESAEWFPPKYGTVVCDGNDCIYTPNKDTFPGQDVFTYEVCLIDEPSVCDIAVVHIQGEPEMEPVLDLPPPTTGRNYPEDKPAGWLTCTNIGTDAAQNVSCEVTDLPPGLELGQCTLEGQPFPGDPVNTTVGIGKEVACPIVGKPTGEPGEPTATTGWDDPNPGSDPERREEETGVDGNPPNTRVPVLAPAAVPVDNPFALLLLALGLLGLGSHYARKRRAA